VSLTERITATLRPLLPTLPIVPALSRRNLRIYLAPQCVVAAAVDGDRIAGVVAVPVANPAGHWQAPLAALRAMLAAEATEPSQVAPRRAGRRATLANPPGHIAERHSCRSDFAAGSRHAGSITAPASEPLYDTNTGAVLASLAAQPPLAISLSSRWCHSVMAPWSDALLAEPAATRFLQMQLSAVYGDAARGWSIASDDAPYGQPRAVCGIDGELLDALRSDLGKRCTAIEPIMGTASRMQTGMQAFAIVEPGKLTMATTVRGRIAAICAQPCGAAWQAELVRAWQRWTLRLPELDAIAAVAVIDLSCQAAGQPAGQPALPPLFQLAETPFGPPPVLVPARMQEASCA
jgi:hypothetical protein